MTTDTIRLEIPHGKPFAAVVRLVVGGIASRLDLSYEHMADLQLALDSVLEDETYAVSDRIAAELLLGDGVLDVRLGPLDGGALRRELQGKSGDELDLRRVLATVVEDASVEDEDGESWLRLRKRI